MKATITITTTVTYAGTLADLQHALDLALDCGEIQACISEATKLHQGDRIEDFDDTLGVAMIAGTREAIEREARARVEAAFVADEARATRISREVAGAEVFWWHKLTVPQLQALIAGLA